jgi:hypothetical protein
MSDDQIAKLEALARRIAPTKTPPDFRELFAEIAAFGIDDDLKRRLPDAAEAALLVMAGDPPAWVEQLASEWEANASMSDCSLAGTAVSDCSLRCAAELRERAQGGEL